MMHPSILGLVYNCASCFIISSSKKKNGLQMNLVDLPDDVLLLTASFLCIHDVAACRAANRRLRSTFIPNGFGGISSTAAGKHRFKATPCRPQMHSPFTFAEMTWLMDVSVSVSLEAINTPPTLCLADFWNQCFRSVGNCYSIGMQHEAARNACGRTVTTTARHPPNCGAAAAGPYNGRVSFSRMVVVGELAGRFSSPSPSPSFFLLLGVSWRPLFGTSAPALIAFLFKA